MCWYWIKIINSSIQNGICNYFIGQRVVGKKTCLSSFQGTRFYTSGEPVIWICVIIQSTNTYVMKRMELWIFSSFNSWTELVLINWKWDGNLFTKGAYFNLILIFTKIISQKNDFKNCLSTYIYIYNKDILACKEWIQFLFWQHLLKDENHYYPYRKF
jgi:hypothetical protein